MPRPGSAYSGAWPAVRLAVLVRDGYRCRIRLPGCLDVADQVDHIDSLLRGGARLDMANLRAACQPCNVAMRNLERYGKRPAPHPSRDW